MQDRGPATEWYESNVDASTTWDNFETNTMARFSDRRNKFRHRIDVEHCIRKDGKDVQIFYHQIKRILDEGWPDDMSGILNSQQIAGGEAGYFLPPPTFDSSFP